MNLDPANETLPYPTDISILELISLEDTMENLQLGPNGGIIYCMEYLADNMDWLEEKLKACGEDYIVFDCPGQVELYTHNDAMKRILNRLEKIGYRVSKGRHEHLSRDCINQHSADFALALVSFGTSL